MAAAGLVVLAGVAVAVTAYTLGRSSGKSTATLEQTIACTNIRREHDVWTQGVKQLDALQNLNSSIFEVTFEDLAEDAEAFYKAVSGYPDQPSKKLAADVAGYRYELSLLRLESQLQGHVSLEGLLKTVEAFQTVETSYLEYMRTACA